MVVDFTASWVSRGMEILRSILPGAAFVLLAGSGCGGDSAGSVDFSGGGGTGPIGDGDGDGDGTGGDGDGDGDGGESILFDVATNESGSPCDPDCLFPIADHIDLDYVVWCEEDRHMYVPRPTWAMAAMHASRVMAHYTGDIKTTVSPNWFMATALKESQLGCDPEVPGDLHHPEAQWTAQPASYGDGCFQITPPAVLELSKVFPAHVPEDHAGVVGDDNFETSALTMAFFDAFAMVRACEYTEGASAREWLATMEDPLGQMKVFVLGYNQGLFNPQEFGKSISECHDAEEVISCVWPDAPDYEADLPVGCPNGPPNPASPALEYAYAIGHYVEQLDAAAIDGQCYDEPFTEDDVLRYLQEASVLFPELAEADSQDAVLQAFDQVAGEDGEVGFQHGFVKVLEAIEDHQGPFQDPWPQVETRYGADNPAQCDEIDPDYLPPIDESCGAVG
jgi:hypothetical protein